MNARRQRRLGSMSALIEAAVATFALLRPAAALELHAFSVHDTDAASALRTLGRQGGIQVLASAEDLAGKHFNPVVGSMTTVQALTTFLAGSGLNYRYVGQTAVALVDDGPIRREKSRPSDENAAPRPAAPAMSTGSELQEVVVTAQRREESISTVPISMTAITQQNMDALGIKDLNDVARFVPGVVVDTTGTNTIEIRGISSSGAGASTTGIYIDDTPIQMRALGANPDQALPKAFDLQRIEVLRGPQGTLFGAGSEGGTVRYILTPPSDTTTSTYARTEISYTRNGAGNYEAGVAHGGPIIDNELGFRVSAWFRQDGGWIDRYDPYTGALVDPNTNHQGTLVLRAALLWQPESNLTITPSVIYQSRKRHNVESYWSTFSAPAADRYGTGRVTPQIQPDRFYLPMLKVQYDIGSVRLISNTSYYNRYDSSGYDGTIYALGAYSTELPGAPATPRYSPSNPYYPLVDSRGIHLPAALSGYSQPGYVTNWQQNITQEVRLQSNDPSSPLTWTAGIYWETDRNFSSEELRIQSLAEETLADEILFGAPPDTAVTALGLPLYGAPFLPNNDAYYLRNWGHDEQVAVYGELAYTLGPVTLTAGGRYSDTWFDFSTSTLSANFYAPSFGNSGHASSRPFTPRLGVQYHIDENNHLYATYSEGFRVGGTNPPIPPNVGCDSSEALIGKTPPLTYQPDKVKSYEIGAKNNLLNNRAQLFSSIYYIKWNGIQQLVGLASCGLAYTDNVGYAVSKGADLQANFLITPQLTLNLTGSYNSAYFTKTLPNNLAIAGERLAALPTWQATLSLQYATQLLEHESFVRFDYEYQGVNNRLAPGEDIRSSQYAPYSFRLPATRFASLRAGVHVGSWEIDAFCDNLFNTHTIINYLQGGVDTTNFNPNDPTNLPPPPLNEYFSFQPRTVGITAVFSH